MAGDARSNLPKSVFNGEWVVRWVEGVMGRCGKEVARLFWHSIGRIMQPLLTAPLHATGRASKGGGSEYCTVQNSVESSPMVDWRAEDRPWMK